MLDNKEHISPPLYHVSKYGLNNGDISKCQITIPPYVFYCTLSFGPGKKSHSIWNKRNQSSLWVAIKMTIKQNEAKKWWWWPPRHCGILRGSHATSSSHKKEFESLTSFYNLILFWLPFLLLPNLCHRINFHWGRWAALSISWNEMPF